MIIMPVISPDTTKQEQIAKIIEEVQELYDCEKVQEGVARELAEAFDIIQATISYMKKIGTKQEIGLAGAVHFQKLKNRGWVNDGEIEINFR